MTKELVRALTIRQAVALALELLPALAPDFVDEKMRSAIRANVRTYVHDYAKRRGVLLEDSDIDSELDTLTRWTRAIRATP